MRVFTKVVEQGSFVRAAERLEMSTSAVSRHVSDLEALLSVRLLNRTTRRIALTESGRAYFERALNLLADLDETEAVVSSSNVTPRGTIRLTCATSFGVPLLAPAIGAFQARYPDVKFDVSTSGGFVDLVEEGLDLAIRIGDVGSPNLIARRIGSMQMMACATMGYLKARGTPKRPADLLTHNCFTYAHSTPSNRWAFLSKTGEDASVAVTGSVHANSGEVLVAIAAAGAGITFSPSFVIEPYLQSKQLVEVLKNFRSAPFPIYAMYPSRRHLSAKIRVFVDFLAARFGGGRRAD